ncbi:MAG: ABC transporter permease [Planctomycetaceae bacterium]|nr:ABC transporter permease [Planctomycetaceae bacterium]
MKLRQALLPILVIIEFACFLPFGGGFWGDLEIVLVHAAPLLVLALGMTVVLITGGIDLSAGSLTALIACVMSTFAGGPQFWYTAVPVGFLMAVVLGWFNGFLIAKMDIPPIIATLGTLFFYRGLCFVVLPGSTNSTVFNRVPAYIWFGEFPGAVLLAVIAVGLAGLWFFWSRWRREVLMLGGNPIAARYAGIPVDRRLLQVYTLMGLCAFLAAWMGTAREGSVNADWQQGLEMQVIVSVVLGGTRVDGGFGSVWGSVWGVFLVVVLDDGLRLISQSELQPVLLGLLLLIGVKLNSGLIPRWFSKPSRTQPAS